MVTFDFGKMYLSFIELHEVIKIGLESSSPIS